jgi:hypothetical protein
VRPSENESPAPGPTSWIPTTCRPWPHATSCGPACALLPEIEALAAGARDGSERQRQIVQLISRIVVAEMRYRADHPADPEA